jgi:hypothetical protein
MKEGETMSVLDIQKPLPKSGGMLHYSSLLPIEEGVLEKMDQALGESRLAVRDLLKRMQLYEGNVRQKSRFNEIVKYHFKLHNEMKSEGIAEKRIIEKGESGKEEEYLFSAFSSS